MKRKTILLSLSLASLFCLTGCNVQMSVSIYHNSTTTSVTSSEDSSSVESLSSSEKQSSSSETSSAQDTSVESQSSSQDEALGYVTGKLNYKITDYNNAATPNTGSVSVLVVPIDLSTASDASSFTLDTFNDETLSFINTNYFGETGVATGYGDGDTYPTFKKYYETVSNGAISIDGMVAPVYHVDSSFSIASAKTNEYNETIHELFGKATKYIEDNNTTINWSNYDKNNDGEFDAIHFISNYHNASWDDDNFWPHQSYTNLDHITNYVVPNVYSLSSIEHFDNAMTAIHEQGHMFGLDDYYDYSSSIKEIDNVECCYDFVGNYDMQDMNMGDWNPYSKMLTGWANPTVINGEKDSVTVTINASSLDGSCLVVPANASTFNWSPFDEYFVFELLDTSSYLNKWSADIWKECYSRDLGDYGVRAYYVNAQLYGEYNNKEYLLSAPDSKNYSYIAACANNSRDYTDYGTGIESYSSSPLISLISKADSAKFTTYNTNGSLTLKRPDLFVEGDKFTFDSAKCALKKGGEASTSMFKNNETWPYEITFDSMSNTSMTVTVKKVA